jgi:hypothetical protein
MPAAIHLLKAARTAATESTPVSEPRRARARAWLKFVVHEPFFQFSVLGLLIWGGVEIWSAHNDRYTIDIGPPQRERIAASYLKQFGQLPTPDQRHGLIDRQIREEIFLREGLALNLDKGDEIVRRRIAQKYEFLQSDLAVPESPTPEVLQRWFEQNKLRYLKSQRVAFSQVYFSGDQQGEQTARKRAIDTLAKLRAGSVSRAPDLGDAFPGPADVAALTPEDATRLFGDCDLSHALFKLPMGQWAGPYRSGYGWHVVYITGYQAPRLPALSEVHERVLADYLEEQRRILNERAFEKLRSKYTIQY